MARARIKRAVILGLDGMDHALTEKWLAEGKLPNFQKLREKGTFKPLATTIPAISPVAWSSFQTGVNPGKHNIFDFLTRDRRTYGAKLSSVEIHPPGRSVSIGKYRYPLGKADIRLMRKAVPFWKTLGRHGIFSNVIRVPITFPPEKFNGIELSAMCVPDIKGTQGMFSYYGSRAKAELEHTGGEYYEVSLNNGRVESQLVGPENPILKEPAPMRCPFSVKLNGEGSAVLSIMDEKIELKKDTYSEWVTVTFKAGPGVKVSGICKFLLKSTSPDFGLYVTPINIDPAKPVMPISHPSVYSTYLAKQFGPYATMGLAEDTWALNEGFISDRDFISQCETFDAERKEMFFDSVDKVKSGLCVCVFDGTDRIQHTFWRQMDEKHPAHGGSFSEHSEPAIEKVYTDADKLLGELMEKCDDENTLLMVMSDHGFNSFRYGVDLNRWLEENGYLVLKEGGRGKKNLAGVDWSRTKAFAIGLAGIFINLKGREAQGIVESGAEAEALRDEIANKLKELYDQHRGCKMVNNVYNAWKVYKGPYREDAPDLLVGFCVGYRASWETAVGQVTDTVIHDNEKAWSGDHCIDTELVPGVLFCNRRIESEKPRIMDIGPTVLEMFGVDVPGHMDGRPLKLAGFETEINKTDTGT